MADEFDVNIWAALQKLGYDTRKSTRSWENWAAVGFHADFGWTGDYMAFVGLAKKECLNHLRSHKELMMSRLIAAVGSYVMPPNTEAPIRVVLVWGHDDNPHEAAYKLWCQVNGVQA